MLIVLSVLISTNILAQEDSIESDVAVISQEEASVFDSMEPDSNIVVTLTKGDIITVLNTSQAWIEVELEDGHTGFVKESDIEFVDTSEDFQEAITLDSTNVYIKPNNNSETISEFQ